MKCLIGFFSKFRKFNSTFLSNECLSMDFMKLLLKSKNRKSTSDENTSGVSSTIWLKEKSSDFIDDDRNMGDERFVIWLRNWISHQNLKGFWARRRRHHIFVNFWTCWQNSRSNIHLDSHWCSIQSRSQSYSVSGWNIH